MADQPTPDDSARFGRLWADYKQPLLAIALGYPSGTEADDVVQDAFVALWQLAMCNHEEWMKLQTEENLLGWLICVVRRKIADRFHARRRFGEPTEDIAEESSQLGRAEPASPDRQIEVAEQKERILFALGRLEPIQESVVRLRFFRGLTHAQIAEELDISDIASRTHLHRALFALRQLTDLNLDAEQ